MPTSLKGLDTSFNITGPNQNIRFHNAQGGPSSFLKGRIGTIRLLKDTRKQLKDSAVEDGQKKTCFEQQVFFVLLNGRFF
jgi:hypothetical protein